ncbi:hypothetical protein L6164_017602 [Bauhinia variegata]|uniref:Uncharacterized protein n=1 Tax=Bauhinia variegata TaxID=167791 RepID=A0ACB9N9Z1_BAUVA|nr:hypothetical protein L6164_017602 [Bauhinia variegata]
MQIEGAHNKHGKGLSIWDDFAHKNLEKIKDRKMLLVTRMNFMRIGNHTCTIFHFDVPLALQEEHGGASGIDDEFPYIDFAGRRFRVGKLENQKVIIVMSGLSLINAGISTQLLLALFNIKGVVHYGIAGNANPEFQIGDVTIPQYWAHTGLWNWQRFGDGTDDELALESVDKTYFEIAKKLEDMTLNGCVNSTTCLPRTPIVARVSRGISASVFVDYSAYREFLYSKFNVTPVEMESAAVALICHQQRKPFITIRALYDLAGGGSDVSNEADIFGSLASENSVEVVRKFISLFSHAGSSSW